jgi:transcription antitermination factor NusA-like protein
MRPREEEERRRKEEQERLERERRERERQEKKKKLLKGEAYVVKDKYFKRCYHLERENGKLILRVPKWLAGHIIGKGGERIKRLQEFLGEKVYIETYDDVVPRKIELSFGW